MSLQVFLGVGCPNNFLVPVSLMYKQDPAELQLAAQCLRQVSVKGSHKECGFRLTCGVKRLLLYECGQSGTIEHCCEDVGIYY
jgi:hypothetical protein